MAQSKKATILISLGGDYYLSMQFHTCSKQVQHFGAEMLFF